MHVPIGIYYVLYTYIYVCIVLWLTQIPIFMSEFGMYRFSKK